MPQRILILVLVYAIILACDYKRLTLAINWREKAVYLIMIVVTLYLGINYVLQWKLPFVYEVFEYIWAVPSKHVSAWLQLSGS
jgi:hypothetical protein